MSTVNFYVAETNSNFCRAVERPAVAFVERPAAS